MNQSNKSGGNLLTIQVSPAQLEVLNLLHGQQAAEMKESLDTTLDTAMFHSTEPITEDLKYEMWRVKSLMRKIGLCASSNPVKIN